MPLQGPQERALGHRDRYPSTGQGRVPLGKELTDSHLRPGQVTASFSKQAEFEMAERDGQHSDQRGREFWGGHGRVTGMEAGEPAGMWEEVRESSRPAEPSISKKSSHGQPGPPPEQEPPIPWASHPLAPHL